MTKHLSSQYVSSCADAFAYARDYLKSFDMPQDALDARLLTCAVCDMSPEDLIRNGDRAIDKLALRLLETYLGRRVAGEPVSRILGYREFYGRQFKIDSATLDPRPDSEVLIEAIHNLDLPADASVLDLGTGSGCLLITLLCEHLMWRGLGVDVSAQALRMSRINASCLHVRERAAFRLSSWFSRVTLQYDLIVSNPPYIARDQIDGLQTEVRAYDPMRALDGGMRGTQPYYEIVGTAHKHLKKGGWLICEIGYDQEKEIREIFSKSGYQDIMCGKDLGGHQRFVLGQHR
ncbi:peptide chain release factor N(5)-glutamine methyltransferase [Alphaproteobacteria bacterium]|nr:peptide chain release factor N(5)-glutamine methyltransferase [Alphaproteobacteria bacterium]